jgi:23S rRNA (guanosine2251-2'-O)-methyltransferase
MAGNAGRRGAVRRAGTKKGMVVGSGGQRRKGLEGRGPTPRADERPTHPKARRKKAASGKAGRPVGQGRRGQPADGSRSGGTETVAGRNAVIEALRSNVPVKALYVAERVDVDDRVREIWRIAAERQLPLLEAPRPELDRITAGVVHQGVALTVPPYEYVHPDDLVTAAQHAGEVPLVVALDGVTDPRNLGAVVRSAAAFAAHGVVVPGRRSAGMTAGAWKASAGAAARTPVARANNLARQLRTYRDNGLSILGLAGEGEVEIGDVDRFEDPLCLVVGGERAGLSRVALQACDVVARIPIGGDVESLNAGVAAGIALYAVAQARRGGLREHVERRRTRPR